MHIIACEYCFKVWGCFTESCIIWRAFAWF